MNNNEQSMTINENNLEIDSTQGGSAEIQRKPAEAQHKVFFVPRVIALPSLYNFLPFVDAAVQQ